MNADTLELRGVVKALAGPTGPVLAGVDLSLPPGVTSGVAGPNGAGKTTLLRVVAGLLVPDAGTVSLGGFDPGRTRRDYQRRVALLSADGGLYARLSVRRHLHWWAAMAHVPRGRRAGLVGGVLADFGLEDLAGRRVERLSAGQRQRVRLAMTFLPAPVVVLLDEPDTRLDDDGLEALARRLAQHGARGGIALWAAPEGRTGSLPADRVLTLRDGLLA